MTKGRAICALPFVMATISLGEVFKDKIPDTKHLIPSTIPSPFQNPDG